MKRGCGKDSPVQLVRQHSALLVTPSVSPLPILQLRCDVTRKALLLALLYVLQVELPPLAPAADPKCAGKKEKRSTSCLR